MRNYTVYASKSTSRVLTVCFALVTAFVICTKAYAISLEERRDAFTRALKTSLADSKPPVKATSQKSFAHRVGDTLVYAKDVNSPWEFTLYTDTECPFCRKQHVVIKHVVENTNYPVKFIVSHFALNTHQPLASEQAAITQCLLWEQGADIAWHAFDYVFSNTMGGGEGILSLSVMADHLGVPVTDFVECAQGQRVREFLNAEQARAQKNVSQTPTLVIRNTSTGESFVHQGLMGLKAMTRFFESR